MCFVIPGKVIEINNDSKEVIVEYGKEKRKARFLFEVNKGDYVIVSNKFIIKKVPEKEALEAINIILENSD